MNREEVRHAKRLIEYIESENKDYFKEAKKTGRKQRKDREKRYSTGEMKL